MNTSRTVLVTGCSSGLGRVTAHLLREEGWRVFATARTAADLARLEEDGLTAVRLDLKAWELGRTCSEGNRDHGVGFFPGR